MSQFSAASNHRSWAARLNRLVYRFSRRWLLFISIIVVVYTGLPWLAPLFMKLGWESAGKAIYLLYTPLCHQMPQRSFFLFGSQPMYSLQEIQAVWQNTNNPLILRQFVGDQGVGWKVAWSDRMVFMYTTILLWGTLFWFVRKRLRPVPWWVLLFFLIPMAIDGSTHAISDLTSGIGLGFRDSNTWLAALTNNTFPATFYSGDGIGSFNSWMRFVTGMLFSLGLVLTLYPRLHSSFVNTASQIEEKLHKAGLKV